MKNICVYPCVLSLALVAGTLLAQDKPVLQTRPDPPAQAKGADISVNAKLVVLSVVVRDRKGALVNGLTKDDFLLKVGGRSIKDKPESVHPQTIKYFDHDTDVPLTLGLLVDVSRSQRDALPDEKKGSEAFLEKTLLPAVGSVPTDKGYRVADKAFVIQFARPVELLQDLTDKRPRLEKALDELGTESRTFHSDETDTTDSEGRREHRGGTSLYDAIYLAANEIQAKQTGRKALVLLTDGVDTGSKESLTDAIEAAQKSDTVIYAVYYKGKQPPQQNDRGPGGGRRGGMGYPGGGGGGYPGGGGGYPGGGGGGYPGGGGGGGNGGGGSNPNGRTEPSRKPNVDGKQVLDRLCGETGGEVFEVSKKLPVDDILTQIGDQLRQQYRIGFTPDADGAKYGYHQIDLELKNSDANKKSRLQVRDGYYAEEAP